MSNQPVVITRKGILHLYPAFEACNLDDSAQKYVFTAGGAEAARTDPRYRRDCLRCHGRLG